MLRKGQSSICFHLEDVWLSLTFSDPTYCSWEKPGITRDRSTLTCQPRQTVFYSKNKKLQCSESGFCISFDGAECIAPDSYCTQLIFYWVVIQFPFSHQMKPVLDHLQLCNRACDKKWLGMITWKFTLNDRGGKNCFGIAEAFLAKHKSVVSQQVFYQLSRAKHCITNWDVYIPPSWDKFHSYISV